MIEEISKNSFSVRIDSSNCHYRKEDLTSIEENLNKNYHAEVWRNDTFTSGINIQSDESEIKDLNIEVSNFKNGTCVLDKENITIKAIKSVKGHMGRGFTHGLIPDFPIEAFPDILYPKIPNDIKPHSLQFLWVSIKIPKETKAGVYTGTISVSASNQIEVQEVNYTIEVFDLVQPELGTKDSISIELWQYPYTVARYYGINEEELFNKKHLDILKEHLLVYKELGGRSITTTIVEDPWNHQTYDQYPSMVKWTKKHDGSFTYDFTHFDAYVELALSLGVDQQIKCFSMVPWENRIFYFDEKSNRLVETRPTPGTDEWHTLWKGFIKTFVKHLENKGWFELSYIALDERPLEDLKHVIHLIKQFKNKEGKTLKIHSAMNYNSVNDPILDDIDDISLNLGFTEHNSDDLRVLSDTRRSKGLTTTLYTATEDYPNSFAYSDPGESAWTIWYAASHFTDGYLRWALDAWVENPLYDISHWYWESGDPFFIYPNDTGEITPYTSPRFEKLKEGMRDVAKAKYLESLSESNQKEIEELFRSVGRVEGKLNEYGAKVAGSIENNNFINDEVERLKKAVNTIAKETLRNQSNYETQ